MNDEQDPIRIPITDIFDLHTVLPKEVAAVVVFVCSERANLLNGACIAVDGGESYSF